MSELTLRERITSYMTSRSQFDGIWFCTWWFRFHVEPFDTKTIRAELVKMEREGLVASDHSQSNNTKWALTKELKA